jgi:hypothetical protein
MQAHIVPRFHLGRFATPPGRHGYVHVVDNGFFHNPNPSAAIDAWPMQHPAIASLLWSVALIALCAPLAAHLYRRRADD